MENVLLIDTNEGRMAKRVQKMALELNQESTIKRLDVGDYAYNNIIIERKTTIDFIQSIRDGRLETQLIDMDNMGNEGFQPYLFISGKFCNVFKEAPYIKGWTTKHTIGSLMSIGARYEFIKVFQFDNDNQLANGIFSLIEKSQKGKKIEAIGIRHSKTMNILNPNFDLYMRLNGVGEKKAKSYVNIYPCFYDFLDDYYNGNLKIKISKSTQQQLDVLFKPKIEKEEKE